MKVGVIEGLCGVPNKLATNCICIWKVLKMNKKVFLLLTVHAIYSIPLSMYLNFQERGCGLSNVLATLIRALRAWKHLFFKWVYLKDLLHVDWVAGLDKKHSINF